MSFVQKQFNLFSACFRLKKRRSFLAAFSIFFVWTAFLIPSPALAFLQNRFIRLKVYKSDGTTFVGILSGAGFSVGQLDFWGRIYAGGQTLNTSAKVVQAEKDFASGRPNNNVLLYNEGTDNFCDLIRYTSPDFRMKHLITGDCSTFQGRASSTWYYSSANCTGAVYAPYNGYYPISTIGNEGFCGPGPAGICILSYYYCLSLNHDQKAFWRGGQDTQGYPSCVYNDNAGYLVGSRSYQSYRLPDGSCVNAGGSISSLVITPTPRVCGSIAVGTGECVVKKQ